MSCPEPSSPPPPTLGPRYLVTAVIVERTSSVCPFPGLFGGSCWSMPCSNATESQTSANAEDQRTRQQRKPFKQNSSSKERQLSPPTVRVRTPISISKSPFHRRGCSYLHVDMPSVLACLLEVADDRLDAGPDNAWIACSFAAQCDEHCRHPTWGRAGVREGLDQSSQTQNGGIANYNQSLLFWSGCACT